MKYVIQVLKEQVKNRSLILRMCSYDVKSQYQMHYLGILWQVINPLLQIMVYWFVFGLGIRGGAPVGETPYLVWLVIGLVGWFFISPSIVKGSNSIYTKISLVSKMKFPVSILPVVSVLTHTINFLIMLVLLGIMLTFYKINPGLYLVQLPYYFISTIAFLFAFTLLASTISIIIRDFQIALQSGMRLLFFLSPVIWDPGNLDKIYQIALKLNPLYYLIDGFRNTFLGQAWFFNDWIYAIYFWSITLIILLVGAFMHIKLRNRFIDYL